SLLSIDSNRPLDSKESPIKTAILFFQSALTEKKPRRRLLSSTTSSCTTVAVWINSITAAPRYVRSLTAPLDTSLATKHTDTRRSCEPFRLHLDISILLQ